MYTAENRQDKCMDVIITGGADVNKQSDTNGDTALTLAAYHEHQQCVKLLIEAEADVNIYVMQQQDGLPFLLTT